MSTQTITEGLTQDDLKALRQADKVCFRLYDGVATVEACLDRGLAAEPRILTAAQQRLFPEVGHLDGERMRKIVVGGSVRWYDAVAGRSTLEGSSAFSMISSAQYTRAWVTVVHLLKAGDVLHLDFEGDAHSNGYTRSAGLHVDTLLLNVRRGSRALTFQVDSRVTPNNTARMVKPY